jgi:hypothetical protein
VSLLIVGGLLIIGVLAIVGVVMLSISEQRRDAVSKIATNQAQSALVSTPHTTEEPTRARPTALLDENKALIPSDEEQLRVTLNGQFHELSHEIHSLHDQAWQLEKRLGILTDMIDHIERSRSGHIIGEEDSVIPLDNTLV